MTRTICVLSVGMLLFPLVTVSRAADQIAPPVALAATFPSSRDGAEQRVRYFIPDNLDRPAPLLVLLHTWSGNVNQDSFLPDCLVEAAKRRWVVIHPDFRGPNTRPEACASELAVQDVVDAVDWISKQVPIDPRRRYVSGASGGGHMTLIMAGRHPELWAAASAWVPISDLAAWHTECTERKLNYAQHLIAVCGGTPGASELVDAQYRQRSPLTHLAHARGLPVDINAGITDGHDGSVPISHSLRAFNHLAEVNGHPSQQFSDEVIADLTIRRQLPAGETAPSTSEEPRLKPILLQRTAGPARVTIFDGGHEGDVKAAMHWLAKHRRE